MHLCAVSRATRACAGSPWRPRPSVRGAVAQVPSPHVQLDPFFQGRLQAGLRKVQTDMANLPANWENDTLVFFYTEKARCVRPKGPVACVVTASGRGPPSHRAAPPPAQRRAPSTASSSATRTTTAPPARTRRQAAAAALAGARRAATSRGAGAWRSRPTTGSTWAATRPWLRSRPWAPGAPLHFTLACPCRASTTRRLSERPRHLRPITAKATCAVGPDQGQPPWSDCAPRLGPRRPQRRDDDQHPALPPPPLRWPHTRFPFALPRARAQRVAAGHLCGAQRRARAGRRLCAGPPEVQHVRGVHGDERRAAAPARRLGPAALPPAQQAPRLLLCRSV